MPFIFNFQKWNTKLTPEQRDKANEIKQKYDGKIVQNREDLIKFWNDLSNDLTALTGKGLYKTNCKYGSHFLLQVSGMANTLAASAPTPLERSNWENIIADMTNAFSEGYSDLADAHQNSALKSQIFTDVKGTDEADFFTEETEQKIDELITKINAAAREELQKIPLNAGEYNNDAFRRDSLEMLVGLTECGLKGNVQEEYSKTDDYMLFKGSSVFIPGMGTYGVSLKPDSKPYVSDYSRFHHLVPLLTPGVKGIRLVNGYNEYRSKGANATKDDELNIREQILVEGNDGLYAIEKIRKNITNERVKNSFEKEVEGAYVDSVGDRGELGKWEALQRARRELIVNGWSMPDITAISRLASLITIADQIKKDLTDTESEALKNLSNKIDSVVHSSPGTEEKRLELINSLIEELDKLPDTTKERFSMFTGMAEDLRRAAEHQLTAAEKEILADPSELKKIADAHPVKEYTDAEQQRDLEWLDNIEAKDKELNDIFKKDPYAHDRIRELQDLTKENPGLIARGVKRVLGQQAWDSFKALPGRESDELKALDILTHNDSPYNVSNNHNTLIDLEKAVKEMTIEIPKKNASCLGRKEFTSIISQLSNAVPSISPGYDALKKTTEISVLVGEKNIFDRQNEYIERLNKVLDSPGNLTNSQQRDEIGHCLFEILGPLSSEASIFEEDTDGLFNKENLSPKEKNEIEKKYISPFGITTGGLMSTAFTEKIMPILKLADKALDRAESLMKEDGHIVTATNLKPIQSTIKGVLKGTATMKIHAMEPLIRIPYANFNSPSALHIDREKKPLIPGKTRDFSTEEIEEKAEAFPIHKVINAEFELKDIWGEYLAEREMGPVSPEKEREYWNRIDNCYKTMETVINDLVAKQEADPTFVDNNMRNMVGQSTPLKSFKDVITDPRAMKNDLVHLKGRREAVNNGWPLSELGMYSHLETLARKIDGNINVLEAGGNETREYTEHLKEFRKILNDRILNKPYEKDPEIRADLYADMAQRIHNLSEERKNLLGSSSLSLKLKNAVDSSIGGVNNVNSNTEDGGMPYEYELKLFEKELRVENAMRKLDELKAVADPIVYFDYKNFINKNPAPKQDYKIVDTSFVEKTDIYLSGIMGDLNRELEAVKAGKETTLESKTGISHDNAVDRIWNMLNASDSLFHVDSKQYKAVKVGLQKLHDKTISADEREKLTNDVKTYLTDPKYDRINKHSKNDFDNTRFNLMFTLANELDPAWAKKNFPDMNIAALHGSKAANTSFHNVHEFTNFMHRQMADGGFLNNAGPIASQHWYLRPDSYGQKGLVEEVLRIRGDASISEQDKLKAEKDNLCKLSGDIPNMTEDIKFKSAFPSLETYRQEIAKLSNEGVNKDDNYFINNKDRLDPYRSEAIKEIKAFLNDTQKRDNPLYDKAALAYGVMDPKGAHEYIVELNNRKVKTRNAPELENVMGEAPMSTTEKKIKPVNLVELEKQQGIDLLGRKSLSKKRMESQEKAVSRDTVRSINP